MIKDFCSLLCSKVCHFRIWSISAISNTAAKIVIVEYIFSCCPLDSFNLIYQCCLPWMPNWSIVLKLRAYICVMCCFSYCLIVCVDVSFNKFQCLLCLRRDSFNVRFPTEIMADCDTQIFSIFSCFQFNIVKFIRINDRNFSFQTL